MIGIISILATLGAHDVSRKEINCLSTAIYHESRGEPLQGQAAVAHVILNRVKLKNYPDTVCKVVYQHKQFSFIEHAKPNRSSKEWESSVAVAALAYTGKTHDLSNGADHYFAHDLVYPRWADAKETTAIIGGHTFKVSLNQ